MSDSPPSLREQKKAETRAAVLRVAHDAFRSKGFEATTLEEICAGARISKRTFFRYFTDKEALVFPNREERLKRFEGFLEGAPDGANPFDTLRSATKLFGSEYMEHRKTLRAQQALIRSHAALRAREHEIDTDWERAIATDFARRLGGAADDLWPRAAAGAIMGVVRSTMSYWYDNGADIDLTRLGLEAIDALERGFPSVIE